MGGSRKEAHMVSQANGKIESVPLCWLRMHLPLSPGANRRICERPEYCETLCLCGDEKDQILSFIPRIEAVSTKSRLLRFESTRSTVSCGFDVLQIFYVKLVGALGDFVIYSQEPHRLIIATRSDSKAFGGFHH